MTKKLHGRARAPVEVRAAIQSSNAPLGELAAQYGLNKKTVAKWRKRGSVEDAPMGPKQRGSRSLLASEEARIKEYRTESRGSLDECLAVLRLEIPALTRSSLYRCWKRHGVHKLADAPLSNAQHVTLPHQSIGLFYLNISAVSVGAESLFVCVAVDAGCRFTFSRILSGSNRSVASIFIKLLIRAIPQRVSAVVIDGVRIRGGSDNQAEDCIANDLERVCMESGIDIVQDGLIKNRARRLMMSVVAFVYSYQSTFSEFENIEKLEMLWAKQTYIYNYLTPIRRGIERLWSSSGKDLTPYETLCQCWRENPKRFLRDPNQLTVERDLKQLIDQRRVEARY